MAWAFMQEHLLGFLLEILAAAVGAWLFAAWYPSISDYRARRSTRAVQKKITQLEEALERYETDFADTRLFVARISRITASTILAAILSMFMMMISLTVENSMLIWCQIKGEKCEDVSLENAYVIFTSSRGILQISALIASCVALFVLFMVGRDFNLQLRPEKYRAYMTDQINRLRPRLTS